ncbi:NAD(H) kinase 1 [Micractinium conductrix]|uniref:NAD(H) kinase 1 n=1 Tax=Micractinium conductrix TaxID=554055 RepID=A0A2P6VMC0_9CHLO|nr:NAD(H) kinase 1 [Micractinium conductrix]|eukprot:PSC75230.1 NAD(H) kinase 1 [Micractinium conductrix]
MVMDDTPGACPARRQQGALDDLLSGVQQAVTEAERQAAAAQVAAVHWQQQYEEERRLRQQLQQQQQQQQRSGSPRRDIPLSPSSARAAALREERTRGLHPSLSLRTAVAHASAAAHARVEPTAAAQRRHTAPALSLPKPELLLEQLSRTTSRLETLREELEAEQAAAAEGQATDGSLALSRLASLLDACSLLRDASAAAVARDAGGPDSPGSCAGSDTSPCGREASQEVALHDDGAAGVGATAAAAVSVALAQSWAAAAGARQAAVQRAAAAEGVVRPGKARFKLVAAVPRSYHRHDRVQAVQSRAALADAAGNGRNGQHSRSPEPGGSLGGGGSELGSPLARTGAMATPFQSATGLVNLGEADPGSLDESAEAQWRASGQHLKLQWLSTPSSVLVVYKPVPAVLPSCVHAIAWLLQRGLTVWAEPSCHAELAEAVAEYLLQRQGGGDAGAATGRGGGGVAAALAAAHGGIPLGSRSAAPAGGLPPPSSQGEGPAALRSGSGSDGFGAVVGSPFASYDGQDVGHSVHVVRSASSGNGHASSPAAAASAAGRWGMPPALCPLAVPVDLPRQLRTWEDPPCGCPPAVPAAVGCQLDLVITLGGDGTVLWTCGLFDKGAVPPLVPFAMGSLGFMTPFGISHMEAVLAGVTGLERGVPLMLRHRLQCRIIRGSGEASTADLPAVAACLEEFVVLNEVVIDRGMKPQLCNLQCYADQNHVTVVQGDGLIVATPTGSTAYNLAAGGAMVHPAVPCYLFTPICPHSLASRPLVLPEHVTLRVKVPLDARSSAFCSFDGRSRMELRPGDSVLISMSQWPAPMVCALDASHDWFLSMREGLSWNVRKQQAGKGR